MSLLFGRWNFDGQHVDDGWVAKMICATEGYKLDVQQIHHDRGIVIGYRSRIDDRLASSEQEHRRSSSQHVVTWDGRLDNRSELLRRLHHDPPTNAADTEIIAEAYETLGTDFLGLTIGDWALAIWNSLERSLLLARDPLGVRSLYYSIDDHHVTWCSALEPLLLMQERPVVLREEYVARYLSGHSVTHATPYDGFDSVPPSASIRIGQRGALRHTDWNFDPGLRIRYRTDRDYEQHFREALAESIRRRLPTTWRVLAELSGGMDSSSIVCMADRLLALGLTEASSLETISYYDDSDPQWNERIYFAKVEERRGRSGFHINVEGLSPFPVDGAASAFFASPDSLAASSEIGARLERFIESRGVRTLLSGVGGDEMLGGIPTPVPELADIFAAFRFRDLARQLTNWSLTKREPWLHLLFKTMRLFLPSYCRSKTHPDFTASLNSDFVKRNKEFLDAPERRLRLFGATPSFQDNLDTLAVLQAQIGTRPFGFACDVAYPLLDRTLLEFVFAIPREQLVRPNERRSLMRRALAGIVPDEILRRPRKAFPRRGPRLALQSEQHRLTDFPDGLVSERIGVVDARLFREHLELAGQGKPIPILPLIRTIRIEYWLRQLQQHGLLDIGASAHGCVALRNSRRRNSIHTGLNVVNSEKEKIRCTPNQRSLSKQARSAPFKARA